MKRIAMKIHCLPKSLFTVLMGFLLLLPAVCFAAVGERTEDRKSSFGLQGPQDVKLAQGLPFQAPESPELETPKPVSPQQKIQGRGGTEQTSGDGNVLKGESTGKSLESSGVGRPAEVAAPSGKPAVKKKRTETKAQQTPLATSPSQKTPLGSSRVQPLGPAALPLGTVGPPVSSRPQLPPALPYQPPVTGRENINRPLPLNPGDNIMARIPQTGAQTQSALQKPRASESGLPSASAIGSQESFDNFVMNSFRGGRVSAPGRPGVQPPMQDIPPNSLFGQISQDIKQLGSGIKQTFSRIIPLAQ
ncbi:MAG: hypothetical protein QG577_2645 [Thermodesulfobacteriota bacterium]|nr:hypothetical protein [Thermodesulfobacteriota bacterium]